MMMILRQNYHLSNNQRDHPTKPNLPSTTETNVYRWPSFCLFSDSSVSRSFSLSSSAMDHIDHHDYMMIVVLMIKMMIKIITTIIIKKMIRCSEASLRVLATDLERDNWKIPCNILHIVIFIIVISLSLLLSLSYISWNGSNLIKMLFSVNFGATDHAVARRPSSLSSSLVSSPMSCSPSRKFSPLIPSSSSPPLIPLSSSSPPSYSSYPMISSPLLPSNHFSPLLSPLSHQFASAGGSPLGTPRSSSAPPPPPHPPQQRANSS